MLEPVLNPADFEFVDHHRDVRPEDFVGKTVASVDARACNLIRFEFTDGTKLALEAEQFIIQACEACATLEE